MKWLENPRNAFLFILGISLLHALYNLHLPLHPDEAYYWLWSRYLDLSYYDHPPMIAYLIRLFSLGSDSLFLIRLTTVFCSGIAAWYIYRLAARMFHPRVAALALILSMLLPATNAGFTLVTPDSPLIMFWAMGLYYCYRALFEGRWQNYLLAGLSIGGMLLSKYTAVLFLGFLLLFLVMRQPKQLLKKEPWLALLLAFLLFSPVLYWNAIHDWISFSFQLEHGSSAEFRIRWGKFLEFFGGLFLLFSPVFFAALLAGLARVKDYWRDDRNFYIALGVLFPLCFFLYKGLFKKMQLNWVAVALIPGVIFLAWFIDSRKLQRTFRYGTAICCLLLSVMFLPGLFPLPGNLNPHSRFFGYREAVAETTRLQLPGEAIFADHLSTASILSYYLPGHPRIPVPIQNRTSQFTFWDRDRDFSKLSGLCLASKNRGDELRKVFAQVSLVKTFVAKAPGMQNRTFYFFRCSGAKTENRQS